MRKFALTMVTILVVGLVAAQLPCGLPLPSTVPAFLWWSHQDGFSNNGATEAVNYQTLSSKELAKSVLSEGGWSNLLCSAKAAQQPVDLALLFVGRELQTSDISGDKYAESALLDLLKVSLTRSNFSLALPYIAASEELEAMESSLISEFAETCGQNFGASKVAFLGSCSLEGGNYEKLVDVQAVHDYLDSRMEERRKGKPDLVVICPGNSRSERQIFSELIHSVEQSGDKYTALYVSDPIRSIEYPSYQELGRFLAESASGNGSDNSTFCDGVCQIKSSLLEGFLVAIVLLIILISGLCCMMGIDTPTRFEAPQDS